MQKNILVTGAGSGIGRELVKELYVRGHRVFAVSRNASRLDALVEETSGAVVHAIAADITTDEGVARVKSAVHAMTARLDAVVNGAGRLVNKPFSELTMADWEAVYRTNVFGVALLVRSLLPLLEEQPGEGHAHIVNISSMGGVQGSMKFAGLSAYSSSKAALCGLTECLAEEFKGKRIRVNALAIGSVQTEMFTAAFPGLEAATTAERMAFFIADFALTGHELFNGKVLPVAASTP